MEYTLTSQYNCMTVPVTGYTWVKLELNDVVVSSVARSTQQDGDVVFARLPAEDYVITSDGTIGTPVPSTRDCCDELAINGRSIKCVDRTVSGITIHGVIDSNAVGFGGALMLGSTGEWESANSGSASTMPCMGLSTEDGIGIRELLLQGTIRNNTWDWTPGKAVYVDATDGELTQTKPVTGIVQIVGHALNPNVIYVNPGVADIE